MRPLPIFILVFVLVCFAIWMLYTGRDQGWASCAAQHDKPTRQWWDTHVDPVRVGKEKHDHQ